MNEKILAAIKELKEKSKKRNFSQTFDLIISLKEFDIKKPENKFVEDIVLPHGRGKEAEVVVFSDAIKDVDCRILTTEDLNKLAKSKRAAKKLVAATDFFLAEPKLMPTIGKVLGAYLAPKGKMPKMFTSSEVKNLVKNYKKSVRVRIKDSPVVQCLVGKDNMKDEEIVENVQEVIKALEAKLPKGKHNISKMMLKLTMGKPVKIEVQ
jgi:large subunit ribosomal protein L1